MPSLLPESPRTQRERRRRPEPPAETPPLPPPLPTARKGAHPLSPALAKIAQRALHVDLEHLRAYQPREIDMQIAEAMLAGHCSFKAIAEATELSAATIGRTMQDPMVCAWVSRAVHNQIQHRLGLVDASMMQRACAGDVRAARLLYDRYGKMVNRSLNVNVQAGGIAADIHKRSDEELIKLAKSAKPTDYEEVPDDSNGG